MNSPRFLFASLLPALISTVLTSCSSQPDSVSDTATIPAKNVTPPETPQATQSSLDPVTKTEPADPGPLPALPPELLVGSDVSCGPYKTIAKTPMPLLADRLRISPPTGTEDIAKAYSIMGAPEPTERETRLIANKNKGKKFVIYTRELFQTEPIDPSLVKGYFSAYHKMQEKDFEYGSIKVADSKLRVVAARPKAPAMDGEAVLVLSLLTTRPDRSMQATDFYVSPSVFKKGSGCGNFATKLAQTLSAGPRLLKTGGKQEETTLGLTLALTLPKGYMMTHKPGPDFDLYKIEKMVPLGSYPGHLTIYLGGHPNEDLPSKSDGSPIDRTGTLAGKPVRWRGFRSKKRGFMMATTARFGKHVRLQAIFVATLNGALLDEFQTIADTISIREN